MGQFLKTYISGTTPIPYETYLARVGVTKLIKKTPGNVFLKEKTRFITVDRTTKEIMIVPNIELPEFYTNLGLKGGDVLTAINDKSYSLDNIYDLITESQKWKENDPIIVKIKRDSKEQILKGAVKLPYEEKESFEATDATKSALKEAWLKG